MIKLRLHLLLSLFLLILPACLRPPKKAAIVDYDKNVIYLEVTTFHQVPWSPEGPFPEKNFDDFVLELHDGVVLPQSGIVRYELHKDFSVETREELKALEIELNIDQHTLDAFFTFARPPRNKDLKGTFRVRKDSVCRKEIKYKGCLKWWKTVGRKECEDGNRESCLWVRILENEERSAGEGKAASNPRPHKTKKKRRKRKAAGK